MICRWRVGRPLSTLPTPTMTMKRTWRITERTSLQPMPNPAGGTTMARRTVNGDLDVLTATDADEDADDGWEEQ